jgi:hypothetical protein
MSIKTIKLNQPFYSKYMSLIKTFAKKISGLKVEKKIQRDNDLWYGLEQANDKPFRWSHPLTKVKIQNVDKTVFVLSDPIGREISFKSKDIDETIVLSPEHQYKIIVSTYGADEITIRVDPFNPESDTRSLGVQYYSITSEDTIVLN